MDRNEILNKIHELKKQGKIVPKDDMIKSDEQIEGIKKASIINTKVLDAVAKIIKPGITSQYIDDVVYNTTKKYKANCPCFGYEGYPKNTCVSINNQVCHGIPSDEVVLKQGDIVNVDCTTEYNGYFGDSSRMFIVGGFTTPSHEKLVRVTKEALDLAFNSIIPFVTTLGDIGYIINKHATENGFSVVREVGGHGVGLKIHEDPYVCHVGKKGQGMILTPGMVFTIEPMINEGKRHVFLDASNEWTIYTDDNSFSAQFEYTIAILEDGAHILAK